MKRYGLSISVSVLVVVLIILDVISPIRVYSAFENRYLSSYKKPTLNSIIDNEFMQDYETYLNDQFVFRDQWISMKSWLEKAMLKQENNGIYFGKDDYLFEKMLNENEQLSINVAHLKKFIELQNQQSIYVAMPLSSYMVYPNYLPKHAPYYNQKAWVDEHLQSLNTIDVFTPLLNHKDMYYRNDHHWTLKGAYLAYVQIMEAMQIQPLPYEDFEIFGVEGFLGTYHAKAKSKHHRADRFEYINPKISYYEFNNEKQGSLIDASKLSQKDKYASLLWGNVGYGKIVVNEVLQPKKMMVIKDSYANSVIPFLTYHFDEIEIVDLRHYSGSVKGLLEDNEISEVLFLYSFSLFASDRNIAKLNY